MLSKRTILLISFLLPITAVSPLAMEEEQIAPLFQIADVDVGETVRLDVGGKQAIVKVLKVEEFRDTLNFSVRQARVVVEVNGEQKELISGTYNLPVAIGEFQMDCPITRGYLSNAGNDAWGLRKDVRLRVWPANFPWIRPHEFVYPVRQQWFASMTQMANEPVYVDGGDIPGKRKIYYHSGLDIGGAEGMVDVIAATDGVVQSSGTDSLPGLEDTPVQPRYDVV
ncbi:MAG TPA: hypothetical protein VKZ59_00380, partial [Acidobacteriota bacterium]|nr:hypothetical protein [Acidobacteriota bacterium]